MRYPMSPSLGKGRLDWLTHMSITSLLVRLALASGVVPAAVVLVGCGATDLPPGGVISGRIVDPDHLRPAALRIWQRDAPFSPFAQIVRPAADGSFVTARLRPASG